MKAQPWIVLALLFAAAAPAASIDPFQASFTVSRNGKDLGVMRMQLTEREPGELEFVSRTEGKQGLAGFLGVTIEERSILRQDESGLTSLSYGYQQDMFGRHRSRKLSISEGAVSESDDDKSWNYAVTGPVLDRHVTVLGIAARLREGVADGSLFDLPVASKGKLESWRFLVVGPEEIDTANGRISAIRVERVRENSDRKTVSWHAPQFGYLPVKVEQIEPDGEQLLSVLQKFEE
ncbi:MAG: DUF3108 domain-containing protein [Rhodanobacteraceae bacterium]|nr:DUF3108 domain-containing protein [Rhodanobacteraceae bacterium]